MFAGEWINGLRVNGRLIYPDQSEYIGPFEDDTPHGKGNFKYPDGDTYSGQYVQGKKRGLHTRIEEGLRLQGGGGGGIRGTSSRASSTARLPNTFGTFKASAKIAAIAHAGTLVNVDNNGAGGGGGGGGGGGVAGVGATAIVPSPSSGGASNELVMRARSFSESESCQVIALRSSSSSSLVVGSARNSLEGGAVGDRAGVSVGGTAASRWEDNRPQLKRRYIIFAADAFIFMAKALETHNPQRFKYYPIKFEKFPDGTDNIHIEGFSPSNMIAGEHVLFLASFHNNDVTLSQFSVLIVLLQSFIESLTIVLPFYPVGTMERVDTEGRVATANTYSMLLSNLPSIGRATRIMIYDLHALQTRFYFHSSVIPSLHSASILLIEKLRLNGITSVAFPDDGACKRFQSIFLKENFEVITCGKVRDGDKRIVHIQEGDVQGKRIVIVDDLVQTGGTLHECALALMSLGALDVSAFVTHGVFPNRAWTKFSRTLANDEDATSNYGSMAVFKRIWLTNSIPLTTSQLPENDVFEVLDLTQLIAEDLDSFANSSPLK